MIKNYTSTVPASRSVQHIEDCLVRHGARNILKEYDEEGKLAGICFIIPREGKMFPFKLPARVENVETVLLGSRRRPPANISQRKKLIEQAERTAWKIVSDWVDVQMSLIELKQAELLEIFLPFAWDPAKKKTFFEAIRENGFKMIPETL